MHHHSVCCGGWLRAQLFALSVGEMGRLVELGRDQREEFYHDPFMSDARSAP